MKIVIPKERNSNETRVAATPETVKKLVGLGAEVVVEKGAGATAYFSDADYEAAGAKLAAANAKPLKDADVVLKVRAPEEAELKSIKSGAMLVAMLDPFRNREQLDAYAAAGVNAFAMELMPRITRAQSMDVLSSQSNLAGYKAVLDAAAVYARALPMMMTAAGTIAPAKVLVMGAGVAGLQAIATAKRLGAVVSATDVRPAAKEQVESLGGKFLVVDSPEAREAETAGGYAKEMSDDFKKAQAELIAKEITKQDIVITTALIPGKPAPRLIDAAMVKSMKPGAVIVDLAVEQGGNVEGSKPGETVEVDGVTIIGHRNVPGRLPVDASMLYAKNLLNFLTPLIDQYSGDLKIDWDDVLIKGTCLTRDGKVVHEAFLSDGAAPKADAAKEAPAPKGTAEEPPAEELNRAAGEGMTPPQKPELTVVSRQDAGAGSADDGQTDGKAGPAGGGGAGAKTKKASKSGAGTGKASGVNDAAASNKTAGEEGKNDA